MSVTMQSVLIVKIAGKSHRLTMEKARDLHSSLCKFLSGTVQTGGAKRVREIQRCTIEHFGLTGEMFVSRARHECYAWPRFIAMSLAREMVPELTLTEIGNEFGREHSLIRYAVKEVANRLTAYPEKRKDVDAIRAKLNGGGQ